MDLCIFYPRARILQIHRYSYHTHTHYILSVLTMEEAEQPVSLTPASQPAKRIVIYSPHAQPARERLSAVPGGAALSLHLPHQWRAGGRAGGGNSASPKLLWLNCRPRGCCQGNTERSRERCSEHVIYTRTQILPPFLSASDKKSKERRRRRRRLAGGEGRTTTGA